MLLGERLLAKSFRISNAPPAPLFSRFPAALSTSSQLATHSHRSHAESPISQGQEEGNPQGFPVVKISPTCSLTCILWQSRGTGEMLHREETKASPCDLPSLHLIYVLLGAGERREEREANKTFQMRASSSAKRDYSSKAAVLSVLRKTNLCCTCRSLFSPFSPSSRQRE